MRPSTDPLADRLAEIGGLLQKLRWEALDGGLPDMARDIAHAIEAIAWAAGISCPGGNIVNRPQDPALPAAATIRAPEALRKSEAA